VASVQPWKVRGIEIHGAIEIVPMGGSKHMDSMTIR
jgi:hypothetical protein